jgi:hypothetical protein
LRPAPSITKQKRKRRGRFADLAFLWWLLIVGATIGEEAVHASSLVAIVTYVSIGVVFFSCHGRRLKEAVYGFKRAFDLISAVKSVGQAVISGLATGTAVGTGSWLVVTATGGNGAGLAVFLIGFGGGSLAAIAFRGFFGTPGFGRIGQPRFLSPGATSKTNSARPVPLWRLALDVLLFPLGLALLPLGIIWFLTEYTAPAADSQSATAVSIYWADRFRGKVIASAYSFLFGAPLLVMVIFGRRTWALDMRSFVALTACASVALSVWFMAWLGAGQVALLNVAELTLGATRGKVSFRRLLEEALNQQVLRQAGTSYQFRHAAVQKWLAQRSENSRADGRHGA